MEKKEFCEELKAGKVRLVNQGYGYSKEYRGSYARYAIYIIRDGDFDYQVNHYNSPWVAEIGYYVKRSRVMAMTVWGMSQAFEAQYQLARLCEGERYQDIYGLIKVLD